MDPIDRITPTRRPPGRIVMKQRWAELLFLHWEVPAQVLEPLLPRDLTLDTFEGRAFVGLVPFTMTGVRPVYLPSFPPLSNFHETNVRTYVHYKGTEPGVWFFSLDAANRIAAKLGRGWFKLPYHFARMSLDRTALEGGGHRTKHHTDRVVPTGTPSARCDVDYRVTSPITPAVPGTLEHFLAERYLLYSHNGRTLFRGAVHHTPYPLQTAEVLSLEESLLAASHITRADTAPLAHFASEVVVDIFPLKPVAG